MKKYEVELSSPFYEENHTFTILAEEHELITRIEDYAYSYYDKGYYKIVAVNPVDQEPLVKTIDNRLPVPSVKAIIQFLELHDIKVNLVKTGNPNYQRGFITRDEVSLGRLCVINGTYDHVKWYSGSFVGKAYLCQALDFFVSHHAFVSSTTYDKALIKVAAERKVSKHTKKIGAAAPYKLREAIKGLLGISQ